MIYPSGLNIVEGSVQEKIIHNIMLTPNITIKALSNKTGLTTDGIKYHLALLRKAGKIKRIGSSKKGKWLIITTHAP